MCGICSKLGVNIHDPRKTDLEGVGSIADGAVDFQLDQFAGLGFTYRGKPIASLTRVIDQIDAGRSVPVSNGVITYTFLDLNHLTGIYNNPEYGFEAGLGLGSYSDAQRVQARLSVQLWDDLVAPTFRETKGLGADIQFANSADPAQAYAYYPGNGPKYQSDVFTADPALNPTNNWFTYGGYGTTTLVHELGHSLGLSHPGAYNFDPNVPQTYLGLAEYAQDSTQYSIMSYWSASETGARIVNWSEFLFSNAQTPLLHDILTIQSKYGADLTTRSGNTTYGFNSNAGRDVYDFNKNPYPYLSIYDAGGIDTLDLSGFTASNFIDLHAGSFSSVGQGAPTAASVNAARQNLVDLGILGPGAPLTQAGINATIASFQNANATGILADTGVGGITATEFQNLSIAYGTTIENAIGGSARDLIWGNEVANSLDGRGGDDVLNGYQGADRLTGGTGNDHFVFSHLEKGDVIVDFTLGDRIDLRALDANAVTGSDQAFAFIGSAAFGNVAGQLRYSGGLLSGDTNGDGVADFTVLIANNAALTTGDFFL